MENIKAVPDTDININKDVETENAETWLEESAEQADDDFPLSGGETDEDLAAAIKPDDTDEDAS